MSKTKAGTGWIPVSERLPEIDADVLVWDTQNGVDRGALRQPRDGRGRVWWGHYTGYFKFRDVSHWQPLPEAPKMEHADE